MNGDQRLVFHVLLVLERLDTVKFGVTLGFVGKELDPKLLFLLIRPKWEI